MFENTWISMSDYLQLYYSMTGDKNNISMSNIYPFWRDTQLNLVYPFEPFLPLAEDTHIHFVSILGYNTAFTKFSDGIYPKVFKVYCNSTKNFYGLSKDMTISTIYIDIKHYFKLALDLLELYSNTKKSAKLSKIATEYNDITSYFRNEVLGGITTEILELFESYDNTKSVFTLTNNDQLTFKNLNPVTTYTVESFY